MVFFAGQKLTAAALNSAIPLGETQSVIVSAFGSTTSTVYTATLASVGTVTLAYVAPPSGIIEVTFTAVIVPSIANLSGLVSVALTGAAGTVAASDNHHAYATTTDAANDYGGTVTKSVLFTGLTAGAAGTITMHHRASSATSVEFGYRQLKWRPIGV